uniref:Uncharacterized protein n=1 Tax=Arundo donax TaxID=35708 RepID=A0A0A8YTR3_ARUDO
MNQESHWFVNGPVLKNCNCICNKSLFNKRGRNDRHAVSAFLTHYIHGASSYICA